MNIGIDLDNTLVDYDEAFRASTEFLKIPVPLSVLSKSQIREFIRSQPDGEHIWQKLQGLAYGRYVPSHAKLCPGAKRFLWRCRQQGHRVSVVSHKTEYGHFDIEKISLRGIATKFLENHGLWGTNHALIQELIFTNTREEKIICINKRAFDWYIDDLYEVIQELDNSDHLKVIYLAHTGYYAPEDSAATSLSTRLSDWQQIDALINGEWSFSEINRLSFHLMKLEVQSLEKVSVGGNAGVHRLVLEDNSAVKLKIYPVDSHHDRLFSEFIATRGLSDLGFQCVSKPLADDLELGVGIYEWIDGDRVINPNQQDLRSSLSFLSKLHMIRNSKQFKDAPLASASCFSGRNIENQMKHRLDDFEASRMQYSELDKFLGVAFIPIMEDLINRAQNNWPGNGGFENPIPKTQQTLSPSDFGFHNALRRPDGSLVFIDFEYFGWDDPVKLMSDFSFHPGMTLSNEQKSFWLNDALKIYGEDLHERLNVCRPLYGLIWCLIFLNDFRPEIWQRRLLSDDSRHARKQEILNGQLAKARTLLQDIRAITQTHI
jgi:hypothetical protein